MFGCSLESYSIFCWRTSCYHSRRTVYRGFRQRAWKKYIDNNQFNSTCLSYLRFSLFAEDSWKKNTISYFARYFDSSKFGSCCFDDLFKGIVEHYHHVHLYGCLWCFLYSPCVVISNLDHPCKTIYDPKHCAMAIFSDFYSSSTINNWLYAELQSISSVYLFRSLHLYRFSPCLQNAKRARWKILL